MWKEKARQAMEEHRRLYPSYRYNPRDQQNRAQSAGRAKRKVKEIAGPPLDPDRCEEIARMLVGGKKGNELEVAVREMDRETAAWAPEPELAIVQTRFDPPMTERTFRRRSLSVPAQAKEEDAVSELPSSVTKNRSRKSSRKRSQSASVIKFEAHEDVAPTMPVRQYSEGSDQSTPFKYFAGPRKVSVSSYTPNHCAHLSSRRAVLRPELDFTTSLPSLHQQLGLIEK